MNDREPEWLEKLRLRWTQPNPSRFLRPNAHLYLRPDGDRFLRHDHARFDPLGELARKYSPDQPRVPAGNPDGGQWTHEGGGGINDTRVISDASLPKLGERYASRASRGGSRPPMGQFSGTPRQEAELQATQVRAGRVIDAIARVDPYWRPEPSFKSPQNIEQAISFQRSLALEAETRLDVLFRLNITPESLRPNEIGRPMVEGILSS